MIWFNKVVIYFVVLYEYFGILEDRRYNKYYYKFRASYSIYKKVSSKKLSLTIHRYFYLVTIDLNGADYKIRLKKNSSDFLVFYQILIKEELRPVIDLILRKGLDVNTVVDAGANIGLTSLYIQAYLEVDMIIALEPSELNYSRLVNNIELNNIKSIICDNRGIWSKTKNLIGSTDFRDGKDWAFALKVPHNKETGNIRVLAIGRLMELYKVADIGWMKIDIEGAEEEIFRSDTSWLSKVKLITIEIHDERVDRNRIIKTLENYSFSLSYSGELVIGVNESLL